LADRPQPAYEGDEPYVFVSYAHEDDDLVYAEIRWLQDNDFNVWYDEGIHGASRWRDELAARIQSCHLFLFYTSPQSVVSQVCREELEFALDRDRPILSVYLEPTTLPDGIKLAITNRQALFRYGLDVEDYTRKLASVVATRLDQPLPESTVPIATNRKSGIAKWRVGASVTGLALLMLMSGMWIASLFDRELPSIAGGVKEFSIDLGPSSSILNQNDVAEELRSELAMSADGKRFIYSRTVRGPDGEQGGLFLRRLSNMESSQVADVSLLSPFFSPDGNWIAGVAAAWPLMRIPLAGGSPQVITEGGWPPLGGTWLEDNTIVFTRQNDEDAHDMFDQSPGFRLYRTSAEGGEVTRLTTPDEAANEYGHRRPEALPGGKSILFDIVRIDPNVATSPADSEADLSVDIALLDLDSGEYRTLIKQGHGPRYASSGHIVFTRGSDIWAVAFDPSSGSIAGKESLVRSGVQVTNLGYGNVPYAISSEGSLVMLPEAESFLPMLQFVWVARNGAVESIDVPKGMYSWPRVSPDGGRLVVEKREELLGNSDLWVHEFNRPASLSRITSDAGVDGSPLWMPGGEQIIFGSSRLGQYNMFQMRADGAGDPSRLLASPTLQAPSALSPDGSTIVFSELNEATGFDIGTLRLDTTKRANALVQTGFHEGTASISPNGRWIIYGSSDGGQIYLRPYPNVADGKWQVSTQGGSEPLWSLDGTEIFYRTGSHMMSVRVATTPEVKLESPQILFADAYRRSPDGSRQYDLEYPEGKRFLMLKPAPRDDSTRLVYVHNWFDELRRLAPPD
jgi:serine/threonine-protein kinase